MSPWATFLVPLPWLFSMCLCLPYWPPLGVSLCSLSSNEKRGSGRPQGGAGGCNSPRHRGFKGGVNHPFGVGGFSCPRMSVPAIAWAISSSESTDDSFYTSKHFFQWNHIYHYQTASLIPLPLRGMGGVPIPLISMPLSFLKDETVFMFDWNQERIRLLISPFVATAVMLNFDDDCL